MIEGIFYCGTVSKVLRRGKSGFIRIAVTGEEVFFNRNSLTPDMEPLKEGDFVSVKVAQAFDEEKGRINMVAVHIERE